MSIVTSSASALPAEGPAWAALLGLLGLVFGSFIAALAIRWPAGRSVLVGRSACDGCGRTLAPYELVPLLSALVLRGRCRSCGARIDALHAIVEALALAIGASAGLLLPGIEGAAVAIFGWLLLALGAIDARALWLPDPLVAALALAGLGGAALGIAPSIEERLIAGIGGFALLALIGAGYGRMIGRAALGGGDPKLFGAIGLWTGWRLLPTVMVLAGLIGLGVALAIRASGRPVERGTEFPLGTFLALAAYPVELAMLAGGP